MFAKYFAILVFMFSIVFVAHAEEPRTRDQWEPVATKSIYEILKEENGKIISTDALSWPDGRSALITILQTGQDLYRCVDFKNESFQNAGFFCHKLISPKK